MKKNLMSVIRISSALISMCLFIAIFGVGASFADTAPSESYQVSYSMCDAYKYTAEEGINSLAHGTASPETSTAINSMSDNVVSLGTTESISSQNINSKLIYVPVEVTVTVPANTEFYLQHNIDAVATRVVANANATSTFTAAVYYLGESDNSSALIFYPYYSGGKNRDGSDSLEIATAYQGVSAATSTDFTLIADKVIAYENYTDTPMDVTHYFGVVLITQNASAHSNTATANFTFTSEQVQGGEQSHTHEWSEEYEYDETHHWHRCTSHECDVYDRNYKNIEGSGTEAHNIVDGSCTECGVHFHGSEMFTPGSWSASYGYVYTHNMNIVLNADYQSGSIKVQSDAVVNICLNGHTLDLVDKSLTVAAGGTLNIHDCSADSTGKIISATTDSWSGAIKVSGIYNQYGGTVENTTSDVTTSCAVITPEANGEINISGGKAIGARGIILYNAGTLNVSGTAYIEGRLNNNASNCGIYLYRGVKATISGGTVKGYYAISTDASSSEIPEIYISGTAKIIATGSDGEGIYNHGVLKISGGEITGNYGIAAYNSSQIYLSGTPKITGTTASIYNGADPASIYGSDGDAAYSGDMLTVVLPSYALEIGSVVISGASECQDKFSVTNAGYDLEYSDGDLVLALHTHTPAQEWTFNSTHHWHECTLDGCTVTENSEKDSYAAHTPGICTECGVLAVNEANFPDAIFRGYIAENFDTDSDGLLSSEEIAAVTEINVSIEASYSYTNISDLTGIEYFTNLVTLNAGYTKISSIDVSIFTKLETLHLNRCYNLKKLDLTANTELAVLDVSDTGLTELDLSNNPHACLLMGENIACVKLEHCGVGYVEMSQFGDVSRMTIDSGGTLIDGWLKLDADATSIVYEYDTKNNPQNGVLFKVEIIIHSDNFAHTYVANTISKDENGHYTEWCETCRTGNEESVAKHTYYSLPETAEGEANHWQFCDSCGFKKIEAHVFTAACDETCRDCPAERDIPREQHIIYKYEDVDSSTKHAAYCSTCDNILGWEHEYEFACTEVCPYCNHPNPNLVAHTEKITTEADGTHNKVCSVCAKVIAENIGHIAVTDEAVAPTCTETGLTEGSHCSVCNETLVAQQVVDATGHSYTVPEKDDTYHWNKCSDCDAIDEKVKHSAAEDGDCKTEEKCSCGAVVIAAKNEHSFDNSCDTTCGNPGCTYTREITHTPRADDGDCTTAIHCAFCDAMTTPGNPSHDLYNACDTDCNRTDCDYTRTVPHAPNADDGNCLTEIRCSICNAVTTAAKNEHSFDNSCDTTCGNLGCKYTREITHTPATDDGDCTTDIFCSVCNAVTTKGNESHTGGTATCTAKAECSVCGTGYGTLTEHIYDNACDAYCNICDEARTPAEHNFSDDGICTECGFATPKDESETPETPDNSGAEDTEEKDDYGFFWWFWWLIDAIVGIFNAITDFFANLFKF